MLSALSFFKKFETLTPTQASLLKLPFFSQLKPRELAILEQIVHQREYLTDEIIFGEGDEGLGMYVIVQGKVNIFKKTPEGKKELAILGSGDFFGELALLEGFPRTAAAVAMEPTTLLGFFRPEFFELIESQPRLGIKLTTALAKHTARRMKLNIDRQEGITSF
jgi:CRP/FNR family cyclic AMP-dependent transcriptional regulator